MNCNVSYVINFSPDGTALATASADGQVKFFQVYMHGTENPRCLHQWKPHDGQPVSTLFFLDNHKDHQPDEQFWKFALTGSCKNTELKLWSCENWTCLQTVQIKSGPTGMIDGKPMALKAVLDLSAQYLLLSDIHRNHVYALQLEIKDDKVSIRIHYCILLAISVLKYFVYKFLDFFSNFIEAVYQFLISLLWKIFYFNKETPHFFL